MMFRRIQIARCLLLALALGAGATARAQTSWASAAGGDWNTAANWSPAVVPGIGTNVSITVGSTSFTVTYSSPMSAPDIASLTLGSSTSIPTLTISAAGFNVAGSCTFVDSSAEIINLNNGGVMTNATLDMASRNCVVNVNSGGVMTNGATQVSNNGSNDGSVTLKVNPGATANLGTVTIGRNTESSSYGLQIAGGAVTATSIAVGTRNSYASMAVSAGTVTDAGGLQLGTGSPTAGREMRYYQTGGTVTCAGTMDMSVAASATTWFSVLNSLSTFSAAGVRIFPNAVSSPVARFTNSGSMYLGASGFNALNSGTYTVSLNDQGLLGASADWSGNVNAVVPSGTFTFKCADINGVAHNITLTGGISGGGGLAKSGGGTLALNGADAYLGATTVTAGSLVLGNAGALPKGTALTLGGSGTAGLLDLAGFNAQIGNLAVGSGATAASQIITNSSAASTPTLTFSNSAANATFGGVIAGGSKPIALTVLGGSLTLSGQNAYGGNLFLSNGKLALSGAGSTFSGAQIVLSNSAATLDISGMGGISLGAGQSLAGYGVVTGSVAAANGPVSPGFVGTAGTLSFSNNLALNGGVTNHFDLALDPASAGNDLIIVAGALNLSGLNTIEVAPLGASLSAGTYKLIQFGSLGGGGAANFQLTGTFGASLQAALNVTATEVDLVVSPVGGTQRTWVGDGSLNAWDYTTTNWWDGAALDVFNDGDFVAFDDTGSMSPPVDLTATLQPATVLVNAVGNYTFGGVGQISGAGTLTKTNSGALIILTTNSYTGLTILGQGVLQLGNGAASGSLGTNTIQNSGALVLDQPGTSTFANLVVGAGSLVKAGPGTLILTVSNSYTGGTTISNGVLQLNTGAWFGNGGVTNNGALVFNSSGNPVVAAVISGTGTVTVTNTGTVTLTGKNTYGGGTTVGQGTLLVNNSAGSGTGGGAVTVASGGTLGGGGVIGGSVTVNSGGIFSPGNPVGPLTVSNNFTAASGAVLNFTLGTSSDLAVVGGNLNLSGTLNIAAGAGFTSATYTLFTYGGTLTLGALTLNLPANTTATLNTNTPGQVNLVVATLQSNIPAFPGALGFGAGATGARFGGSVYHVTNLNDSGAGSFRDAVSGGNRFVVFDVGGTITLASAVSCSSSLTIAGQTAPGGIAIIGHEISFSVRSNEVVRCVRFRPGSIADDTEDGINMGDGTNMIFDHISIEFAPYDSIDAVGSDANSDLITVQNSILADPISQQFNAHTEALTHHYSWFYNIFSSGHDRNPLAKINTVFINNVVYNFQAGYTCADTSGSFSHDIINNYFITGPSTTSPGDDFFQFDGNQSVYASGNLLDSANNGTLGGSSTAPGGVVVLSSPWSPITPTIPTASPASAYRSDVSWAGPQPLDQVDQLVMADVTSLGTSGRLWSSQTDTGLGNNGYGVINGGTPPVDTSGDGLPDYWKAAIGANTNQSVSLTPGWGGYTKLENYLNWLAGPHTVATNYIVLVDLSQYAAGFATVSPAYSVSGATNGTVSLLADGHTARFIFPNGFSGLGGFNFAVAGNDGTTMTNGVGLVISPLTVTGTNQPPVANPDFASVIEDSAANVLTPLTNDVLQAPGGSLSVIAVSPTNGTASIVGGTNVLFTPAAEFVGTATIGYTITDGVGGTNSSLITVTVTPLGPLQIGGITLVGTGVAFNGTNGAPNGNFYLLGSSNLALPLAQWTRLATNQFGPNGNFNFTNASATNAPQEFYRLQLP